MIPLFSRTYELRYGKGGDYSRSFSSSFTIFSHNSSGLSGKCSVTSVSSTRSHVGGLNPYFVVSFHDVTVEDTVIGDVIVVLNRALKETLKVP